MEVINFLLQIAQWISEVKGPQSVTLIGLTDLETEGKFVWGSGRPLSEDVAAFWKPGQPNNHYGLEHCTCIVNGVMMDRICETPSPKDPQPHGFVCQKRINAGIYAKKILVLNLNNFCFIPVLREV